MRCASILKLSFLLFAISLSGCGPIGAIKSNQQLIQKLAYGAKIRNPQDKYAAQNFNKARANAKRGVNMLPPGGLGLLGGFITRLADPATGGPVGALLLTGLAYFRKRREHGEAVDLAKDVAEMEPVEARRNLVKSKVKV